MPITAARMPAYGNEDVYYPQAPLYVMPMLALLAPPIFCQARGVAQQTGRRQRISLRSARCRPTRVNGIAAPNKRPEGLLSCRRAMPQRGLPAALAGHREMPEARPFDETPVSHATRQQAPRRAA